jgi:hypothetical protein
MAAAIAAAEAHAAAPQTTIVRVPQKPDVSELLNAAFAAIARVLAIRFQLLLALIGAWVLALLAMQWQTQASLFVLIADCVLTVLPLVWLEFSGRPRA